MRTITPLLALALAAGGCSFDELVDYIGDSATEMAQSPDPAVQAAGLAAAEIGREQQAKRSLDEAIADKDLGKARIAQEMRPDDPTYAAHVTAMEVVAGEDWRDSATAMFDAIAVATGCPDQITLTEVGGGRGRSHSTP